jgi:hypothetical protein
VLENFPGIKEVIESGEPGFEYIVQMEYPLRVELQPSVQLGLAMLYYCQSFTDESIQIMMEHFQTILLEIIKNPHQPVKELKKLING